MHKHSYALLDGLRGIAAIIVVIFHTTRYWDVKFYRSYLAVDLFFLLSGFVIAYAYDERIKNRTLSFFGFFKKRLIRLYPIFLLSLILSTLIFLGTGVTDPNRQTDALYLFILTALFLPSQVISGSGLFYLNGPYWSLFFELFINFIYAAIRPKLNNKKLIYLVVISGIALTFIAFIHGSLDIGYDWSLLSLSGGFSRAFFGVFLGLVIYEYRYLLIKKFHLKNSPWFAVFIIVFILVSPDIKSFNSIADLLIVTTIFPLMILLASQYKTSRFDGLLLLLGAISYPIYVLHSPVKQVISKFLWGTTYYNLIPNYAPISGLIFLITLICLSAIVVKKYEKQARNWLTNRFFK